MAEKKRYVEYDLMRILACLCVIMIHAAVFNQSENYHYTTFAFQSINIWGVLSRWAVPAFVMLSGMMILPHGDEISIGKLMKRRVFRMLGAYIVWSCIYSFYNVFVLKNVYAGTKLKTWLDGCFSGEIHMWYLPMLAGMYIASPLLAVMIKKLERRWTIYWLGGLFLFSSVIPFFVKLNIRFASVIVDSVNSYMDLQFLGGWTFYFVIGYYIQRHNFLRKEKIAVAVCAILSLAFTMWATVGYYLKHGEAMGVLPYEYPNIVCMSVGALLFFKEIVSRSKLIVKFEKIIRNLSGLTFGIYLIHLLMLKIWYSFGINVQMLHPIVSIPLLAVIVFTSSGIIVWLIRRIPVVGPYFA